MIHNVCTCWLWAAVILLGCHHSNAPEVVNTEPAPRPAPLRLLVVEDLELTEAIRRFSSSLTTVPLNISQATERDFVDQLQAADHIDRFTGWQYEFHDAIIYPPRLMGSLVELGLIAAMPARIEKNEQLAMHDMFPQIRSRELRWGKTLYAVPLGSPHLQLVYRSDVFEKLNFQPPNTWRELSHIAREVSQPEVWSLLEGLVDETTTVLVQPLATESAGTTLLARAASQVVHPGRYSASFDFRTMQPLIDQPPFVGALEALIRDHQYGSAADLDSTPITATHAVLSGKSIMAIGQVVASLDENGNAGQDHLHPIAIAELPGSPKVYNPSTGVWEVREREATFRVPLLGTSGRVGSVVERSRRARGAWNLLVRLSGTEWSMEISPCSYHTAISRPSQTTATSKWVDGKFGPKAIETYTQAIVDAQSRRGFLFVPRLPAQDRYMASLDAAVRSAVAGATVETALQSASLSWNKITDEVGRQRQSHAYQRSLGLMP